MVEFRYSQTIFLRFTVTLFLSNLNEKITSKEQKVQPRRYIEDHLGTSIGSLLGASSGRFRDVILQSGSLAASFELLAHRQA